MANYTTEFLSLYIRKNVQDIKSELTLIGRLFGQIDVINTIKAFDWEIEQQMDTIISQRLGVTMSHKELKDDYPLLSDRVIDVLRYRHSDIDMIDQWYDALFIPDKSTLPRHTPDSAINRMESIGRVTHLNLAISRKRMADDLMDATVRVLQQLFQGHISLMRRVALNEAEPFSTEKAVTIEPIKRRQRPMPKEKGQPVSIDFFNEHGDYAGRGQAVIFHPADDDNLDPFLQDIIDTQDRLPDGWQQDHTIVVESMGSDDPDHFYHHVFRLFKPEQVSHLTKT